MIDNTRITKKRGQPKKNGDAATMPPITIRLNAGETARLDAIRAVTGEARSAVIRRLIREARDR